VVQLNPQAIAILTVERYRPLIDMDGQMFIGMLPNIIFFTILALILSALLYKPVKKILQLRADRMESESRDTALDNASAAELKTLYEQKVKEIEKERADILADARKVATEKRDKLMEAAKAEAQEVKDRATRENVASLKQIKSAAHQAIIDISGDMAAKIIVAKFDKTAQDKIASESLKKLESTSVFGENSATA